jgi:hypothetical protein
MRLKENIVISVPFVSLTFKKSLQQWINREIAFLFQKYELNLMYFQYCIKKTCYLDYVKFITEDAVERTPLFI